MKSVMGQLDRDSLMVLYLAGELSAEDRRRVEGMLEGDAGMRAELEGLRVAQRMVEEGLDRADRAQRLPVEPRVLERRVGRMMREYFLPLLGNFGFLEYLKHDPSVPDSYVTPEYCAQHNWLIGSPATVAEKLERVYRDVGGFGSLLRLCALRGLRGLSRVRRVFRGCVIYGLCGPGGLGVRGEFFGLRHC